VRHGVVHGVRAAGPRYRHVRRHELRLRLHRWLSPVRCCLREQHEPRELWRVVHRLPCPASERDRMVRRHELRLRVQRGTSPLRRGVPERQQHQFVRGVVHTLCRSRERDLDV
jgi:hypothetical protein